TKIKYNYQFNNSTFYGLHAEPSISPLFEN
ncbi:MAG: hypothetical protein ACJA0H_001991, partial [Francisellaceae bacterium]